MDEKVIKFTFNKRTTIMKTMMYLFDFQASTPLFQEVFEFGYFQMLYLLPIISKRMVASIPALPKNISEIEIITSSFLLDFNVLWYASSTTYLIERGISLTIDSMIFMVLLNKMTIRSWKALPLKWLVILKYYFLGAPIVIHLIKPLKCISGEDGAYYIENSATRCYSMTGAVTTILTIISILSQSIISYLTISSYFEMGCKTTGVFSRSNNRDRVLLSIGVICNFLISLFVDEGLRPIAALAVCGILLSLKTNQPQYRNIRIGHISLISFQLGIAVTFLESICVIIGSTATELMLPFLALVALVISFQSMRKINMARYTPLDNHTGKDVIDEDQYFKLEVFTYMMHQSDNNEECRAFVDGFTEMIHRSGSKKLKLHRFRTLLFGSSATQTSCKNSFSAESLKNLISLKYVSALKHSPSNIALRLSYIWFVYETLEYKHEAYQQLSLMMSKGTYLSSWGTLLAAEKMWVLISSEIESFMKKKSNFEITGNLDITLIKKTEIMLKHLDDSSAKTLSLWQYLEEDKIRMDDLTDKIDSCVRVLDKISSVWSINHEAFSLNPSLLIRYGNYLSFVINDDRLADYIKQKANIEMKYRKDERRGFNAIKSLNDSLGSSSIAMVIIKKVTINNSDIQLDIHRCNLSFACMLGYHQETMLELENLGKILPKEWIKVILMSVIKTPDFSFSHQIVYLKKSTGALVKTLASMRNLIDDFFILEIKEEFEGLQIPEIIYSRSDFSIIGHTSSLMKYTEIDYFELRSIGILKMSDISESICSPPTRKRKEMYPNLQIRDYKRDSINSSHTKLASDRLRVAKDKLIMSLNEMIVEKTHLNFCNLESHLGVSVAVFRKRECSHHYNNSYQSAINSNHGFSFHYDIDSLQVVGILGNNNEDKVSNLKNTRLIEFILKSEEIMKHTTRALENKRNFYANDIKVTRLIEGGSKMMEVNLLQNDYDSENISEPDNYKESKKKEDNISLIEYQHNKNMRKPRYAKHKHQELSSNFKIVDIPSTISTLLQTTLVVIVPLFCCFLTICIYSIYQVKSLHYRALSYSSIPLQLITLEQQTTTINSVLTDLQFADYLNVSELDLRYSYIAITIESMKTIVANLGASVIKSGDGKINELFFQEQFEFPGIKQNTTSFNGLRMLLSSGFDITKQEFNRSTVYSKNSPLLESFFYFSDNVYKLMYQMNKDSYEDRFSLISLLCIECVIFLAVTLLFLYLYSKIACDEKNLFLQIRSPSLASLIRRCEKFVAWRGENNNQQNAEDDVQNPGQDGQEPGSLHEGSSVASDINMKGGGLVLGIDHSMVRGLPRRRKIQSQYLSKNILVILLVFLPLFTIIISLEVQSRYKMNDITGFFALFEFFPTIGRIGQLGFLQKKILSEIDDINPKLFEIYLRQTNEYKIAVTMFYFISTLLSIKSTNPEIAKIGVAAETLLYSKNCEMLKAMAEQTPPNYFELEKDLCNKGLVDPDFYTVVLF